MERKKITFDSFIRGSIGCVLVVGILMLVERLSGVLLPFFIAWLIAYMIYPLVKLFQYKLRLKSRILSIFCALFLISAIGITVFYLLVPPMISEMSRMNDLLVTYLTNGAGNNVPKNLSEFIHEYVDLQALNRILSEENILAAIKDTVPRLWTLLAESLNILFSIFTSFIILLYVVFILLDYEAIAEGWLHLLPNKYRTFAEYGSLLADHRFLSYRPTSYSQSCGYRREFLDHHRMCIGCLRCCSNHTRYFPRPQNHGKDHRPKPCHHSLVSLYLGFIDGNARHDYRSAVNDFNAFLLPTFYYQ